MNTSSPELPAPNEGSHPLDEAEKVLGGRAAMGRALGVTPGAIGNWKARGVPIKFCVSIEQLVPTVTRRRLRPTDYLEIWPELERHGAPSKAESEKPIELELVDRRHERRPIDFPDRRTPVEGGR
jgi:DNA-binding transcriptional regulator YdaS (Cro superfamily)